MTSGWVAALLLGFLPGGIGVASGETSSAALLEKKTITADSTVQVIKTVMPDSLQRRLERLLKKPGRPPGMPMLRIDPDRFQMPFYKSPVPLVPMPIYSPCEKYHHRFRPRPPELPNPPRQIPPGRPDP